MEGKRIEEFDFVHGQAYCCVAPSIIDKFKKDSIYSVVNGSFKDGVAALGLEGEEGLVYRSTYSRFVPFVGVVKSPIQLKNTTDIVGKNIKKAEYSSDGELLVLVFEDNSYFSIAIEQLRGSEPELDFAPQLNNDELYAAGLITRGQYEDCIAEDDATSDEDVEQKERADLAHLKDKWGE